MLSKIVCRNTWRIAVALSVSAVLLLSAAAPAQDKRRSVLPEAKYTSGGTQACLRCHAGEAMQVMGETAHGNSGNPHTPYAQQGCESCHGPASEHVARPEQPYGAISIASCTGCHDAANDPDFNYYEERRLVSHEEN